MSDDWWDHAREEYEMEMATRAIEADLARDSGLERRHAEEPPPRKSASVHFRSCHITPKCSSIFLSRSLGSLWSSTGLPESKGTSQTSCCSRKSRSSSAIASCQNYLPPRQSPLIYTVPQPCLSLSPPTMSATACCWERRFRRTPAALRGR